MNEIAVTNWIRRDEGGKIADAMAPSDGPLKQDSAGEWQLVRASRTELVPLGKYATADMFISMRLTYAAFTLKAVVEIDPDKAGGAPVLIGTRFTIARVIAEIAEGATTSKLAREYDLNKEHIVEFLQGLAIMLDRPFVSGP